jgi:uncharacterized protein YjiS (DUF1127 family)
MSTLTLSYHQRHSERSWQSTTAVLTTLLNTWYQRSHQRRQLALLSDRQLDDIGLDRATALAEAAKPFWRP